MFALGCSVGGLEGAEGEDEGSDVGGLVGLFFCKNEPAFCCASCVLINFSVSINKENASFLGIGACVSLNRISKRDKQKEVNTYHLVWKIDRQSPLNID